jgi:hypothetical protein
MIEFFQFLNTCSAARAVTYLLFILILVFAMLTFISTIVDKFTKQNGDENPNSDTSEGSKQQLND